MTDHYTFRFYNSLTRQKEAFVPLEKDHVRIYACGPTVYSYAHIGNARMAVVFDLLARVMRSLYQKVTYVSNITDIEDKIITAAREAGEGIEFVTRKYERIYNEDMATLGVALPDIQPRATETIPEMISLIENMIQRGHAYEKDGHILFNVPSFPEYGGLSGRSRDDQIAGARVEVAPYKKDPADFVLWKPSTPDQPGWNSPWGFGRPGWHIECSAMAEKHLGLPIDIHGGGADLKFPHHENEIAQSCCAHGSHDLASFSKYWIHNGFLTVEGEKMSKSLGNFILAHDLIEQGISGEVIRFVLLSAHYRQPLDWSENGVAMAHKSLDKFYRILDELSDVANIDVKIPSSLIEALCDDLNSPKAYAELNSLAKAAADQKTPESKAAFVAGARLMGFLNQTPAEWFGEATQSADIDTMWVEGLLLERTKARANKNFARSDEIRDELAAKGIVIEDSPQGSKWKLG
ncbi:MAG TPA: cysteine--tRNA ligase [Alphaproteobacteria bacterium]|jgi:cysteinyl-tRNA synthetase|nr:cysteine--tRNA ligase [Alphaproteobacteria bacterium]